MVTRVSYSTAQVQILISGVIERAGGLDTVLKTSRADYFRYLKLVAEVYGVLKLTAEAEVKVSPHPAHTLIV